MSPDQNVIQDLGVIALKRDHSDIHYRFLSLLEIESRKLIQTMLKNDGPHIFDFVTFDIENEPLSIEKDIDVIYFTNFLTDPNQHTVEGTSIVKMSINTLTCIEVYRSK